MYTRQSDGAMGSERRIWQTIRDMMILLCIAIGLAPAFKMKFWNIGAEGQILIGGACSGSSNDLMQGTKCHRFCF